jgi:hypothetical protein
MKLTISNLLTLRTAGIIVIMAGLSAAASAQCGSSITAMVAAARLRPQPSILLSSIPKPTAIMADSGTLPSIIGFWHTRFLVEGNQIQEAYQIYNFGGTEVHNPNVDPSSGNVCLGAWEETSPRTYRLTHRVWLYDPAGNFHGTGHLSEVLVLGNRGRTHSGTFSLKIFDPFGNQVDEVDGTVSAERVSDE